MILKHIKEEKTMTNRITLIRGYVVDIDEGSRNFILKNNIQEGVDKEGKPTETSTTHGYHGSMTQALLTLQKLLTKAKLKKTNTIADYIKAMEEATKEITAIGKVLEGTEIEEYEPEVKVKKTRKKKKV